MGDQQLTFAQPIDKKDLYVLRSFVAGYLTEHEYPHEARDLIAKLDEAIVKAEAEVKEWKAGREKWLELQAKRDRLRARYPQFAHLHPDD